MFASIYILLQTTTGGTRRCFSLIHSTTTKTVVCFYGCTYTPSCIIILLIYIYRVVVPLKYIVRCFIFRYSLPLGLLPSFAACACCIGITGWARACGVIVAHILLLLSLLLLLVSLLLSLSSLSLFRIYTEITDVVYTLSRDDITILYLLAIPIYTYTKGAVWKRAFLFICPK